MREVLARSIERRSDDSPNASELRSKLMNKILEKDYYQLLGVTSNATEEEIKLAYRDLARVYHPDSNFYADIIDSPPTERDQEIFKLITAAYDTLMDPEKRAAYDRTLLRGLKDWGEDERREPELKIRNPMANAGLNSQARPAQGPSATLGTRPFGQRGPENYISRSAAQHTRPIADLLQTTSRSLADRLLLFLGLGLPVLTLAGALFYLLFVRKT